MESIESKNIRHYARGTSLSPVETYWEQLDLETTLIEWKFPASRSQELAPLIEKSMVDAGATLEELAGFCWTLQKESFALWGLSPIEMGRFHMGLKNRKG